MTRTRRWIFIPVFCLLLFGFGRLYYQLTDDFRPKNVIQNPPFHQEWQIGALTPLEKAGLKRLLDQPYTYLGKGAQSYAFLSDDGAVILKLFKSKHSRPSVLIEALPSLFEPYKQKSRAHRKWRMESTLAGYKLAYDEHREASGLLYIHLNPTENLHGKVCVRDKMGFERQIDLDATVYVLQEKGKKLRTVVQELLAEGNIAALKEKLRDIFKLHLSEYAKGIYDRDHGVMHNTGFVQNRAIRLDLGKLTKQELMTHPEHFRKDILKVVQRMWAYFTAHHEEVLDEVGHHIEEVIEELFGQTCSLK